MRAQRIDATLQNGARDLGFDGRLARLLAAASRRLPRKDEAAAYAAASAQEVVIQSLR
jgi:hypothetical protein